MAKVPILKSPVVIRALESVGFTIHHKKGGHVVMTKTGHPDRVVVPNHPSKLVKVGTLRSIIKSAGLTVDAFNSLL